MPKKLITAIIISIILVFFITLLPAKTETTDKQPTPNILTSPETSEQWNVKGNEYLTSKEWDKAIECYNKALEIEPNYAKSLINIGLIYSNKSEYEKAIEYFDKALKLIEEGKDTSAIPLENLFYVKGMALVKNEKYEEAIKCFDKVLDINPDNAIAKENKELALKALNGQLVVTNINNSVGAPKPGKYSFQEMSKLDVVVILTQLDWLYDKNNQLKQDAFDELISRINSLPSAETVNEFGTTLCRISGEDLNSIQVGIFMVQIESFFQKGEFQKVQYNKVLEQLLKIPYKEIENKMKKGMSSSQAALYIACNKKCILVKDYSSKQTKTEWLAKEQAFNVKNYDTLQICIKLKPYKGKKFLHEDGKIYTDIKDLSKALNCEYSYDKENNILTINGDQYNYEYLLKNEKILYVGLTSCCLFLGYKVNYDPTTNILDITKAGVISTTGVVSDLPREGVWVRSSQDNQKYGSYIGDITATIKMYIAQGKNPSKTDIVTVYGDENKLNNDINRIIQSGYLGGNRVFDYYVEFQINKTGNEWKIYICGITKHGSPYRENPVNL